jgi:hypothetical protein
MVLALFGLAIPAVISSLLARPDSYMTNGMYSEPFPTRDSARKAAKLAASEQAAPGETTPISYEDEKGRWHNEVDSGTDHPKAIVEG